jgi:hypothetical protein
MPLQDSGLLPIQFCDKSEGDYQYPGTCEEEEEEGRRRRNKHTKKSSLALSLSH